MDIATEEETKNRMERNRLKTEMITKWTAWTLVTQNTITGNFMNDMDEAELWEKLLALPSEG